MTDIARMSVSERLHTLELLWQSLSAAPCSLESPAWHGGVLADRLASADAGRAQMLSLQEVKTLLDLG